MNFFKRQDEARRASRRLVVLFGLAVLAVVAVAVRWGSVGGSAHPTVSDACLKWVRCEWWEP